MIVWNWNKVNSYFLALKPLRGFPIAQNYRNFGTFWYLRYLEPPGLLENVKDLLRDFLKLKEIEGKMTTRHRPESPFTLQQPQDTLRYTHTLPYHPWHILDIVKGSPKHLQTFLTLNRHHLTPSFLPESSLTSSNKPNASQTVWWVLGSSQGFSWETCEGVWGAWGCFEVSRGVLGVLAGVSMLWEVSGSIFYSIPTNFHGALMKVLTFSRRPEGPRCLKYQNVPKFRSFWAIGKPRERFQIWDIRVYFIALQLDHTVVPYF